MLNFLQYLMFHYASAHESLKGTIPGKEDLQLKKQDNKSKPPKGKPTKSKISSENDPAPVTSLECFMCGFQTEQDNQLKMIQHFAFRHYREDLHGLFGGSIDKCTICGVLFTLESQLLAHYMSKHRALQDLIPELKFQTQDLIPELQFQTQDLIPELQVQTQ